jgi:protein required for attachment to host cells
MCGGLINVLEFPMKHLLEDTRVLVADGAHALVLRNDGDGMFPNLRLERAYEQDNPATRDQGTDKPGRTNDSLGRRSAMDETDWHKVAEDRFVQRVADDMVKDLKAGEFTSFILAAPPEALGEFRKAATSDLTDATIMEIDKDLTNHPIDKIEKIIVKALEEAKA